MTGEEPPDFRRLGIVLAIAAVVILTIVYAKVDQPDPQQPQPGPTASATK